ncbi:MAG: phosphatidate cytidylyltransferase [Heliobacteriaceae bacterium]|nr:phosphatidate cytidylyltransferase [Heliobacteriaceae bacterium]MDD4587242.1 phosphatidate cytidylyltransferase [Heliobacteriaceae bacterium]
MLAERVISGLIGIVLALSIVYFGGWVLTITLAVVALIGFWEYRALLRRSAINPPGWLGYPLIIGLAVSAHYGAKGFEWLITLGVVAAMAYLVVSFPTGQPQDGASAVVGALVVGWLLSYIILLRQLPSGIEAVFLTFFLTWGTDTGAYFIGRRFGKKRLAPRLSPQKTIEGTIGGMVTAGVIGFFCGKLWFPQIDPGFWLIAALVVSLIGQMGDLAESALKRAVGAKDSGKIMPGHGGVLDRIDSLLWTAPAVYYFFLGFGGVV